MASSLDDEDPAATIKSVHASLRMRCLRGEEDPDEVWRRHARDRKTLDEYSKKMSAMARDKWSDGGDDKNDRTAWIRTKIEEYFHKGDKGRILRRIHSKAQTSDVDADPISERQLGVLDVGSCFNPFGRFPDLDVTAVDLAPASDDVLRCDFLGVDVAEDDGSGVSEDPASGGVAALPGSHFDVVVFSLLLEYLPTPAMRYAACRKAASVLRDGGLLAIATPDSCHQGKNQDLMKRWRLGLASLGFFRAYYEKLDHLHCMAYVKAPGEAAKKYCRETLTAELAAKTEVSDMCDDAMVIPQDRTSMKELQKEREEMSKKKNEDDALLDEREVFEMLAVLPNGL